MTEVCEALVRRSILRAKKGVVAPFGILVGFGRGASVSTVCLLRRSGEALSIASASFCTSQIFRYWMKKKPTL